MGWLAGAATLAASTLASAALVLVVRAVARRRALLDHPNERSSHVVPRPRLGGIGVVLPVLAAGAWLVASGGATPGFAVPLGATGAVALLGLADDVRPIPARLRLAVQLGLAAVVVVAAWERLPSAAGSLGGLLPRPALAVLAVLGIAWLTNLYNFMDGIDGLAGSQAALASLALAFVAVGNGAGTTAVLLTALAGASLGFLFFNLPPSSIFMGDVGSTAIGFFLATLPLLPEASPVGVAPVALAVSLFILDATATLVRRAMRGERLTVAHRSHLYQRPVVAGASHGGVLPWAIAGMTLAALCAIAWPVASGRLRWVLGAIPVALFAAGHAAVRGVERKAAG